jgi:hypothetical protein
MFNSFLDFDTLGINFNKLMSSSEQHKDTTKMLFGTEMACHRNAEKTIPK